MEFTKDDAIEALGRSDLNESEVKLWTGLASLYYEGCKRKKKDKKRAMYAATAVMQGHKLETVAWLVSLLKSNNSAEAIDYMDRLIDPEETIESVVESVDLGDGQTLQLLEAESHLAFITENAIFELEAQTSEGTEATEADSTGQVAIFRALQGRNEATGASGISKNKNFYPGEVAESIVPMLEARPKMYLDHKPIAPMGRPFNDLVSMVDEAWAKDGSSFVKADFETGNPQTSWVWGVVEKWPNQVGVSIHAAVKGRKAKIDNQDVFAVEKIDYLFSLDVVDNPSAGGEFQGFAKEGAKYMATESEGIDFEVLEGLKEELDKMKNKSAFWNLSHLLVEMIYSAARNTEMAKEDRQKAIDGLIEEFNEAIKELDPATLFEPKDRSDYYESSTTPVEQFRQVLRQALGQPDDSNEAVIESSTPSPQEDELVTHEDIKGLTFEQLIAAGNEAVIGLKTQLSEAADKHTALEDEITDLKTQVGERDRQIDEYKLQESERQNTETVSGLLAASKVLDVNNPKHVSETFVADLVRIVGEEDGEAKVKARIGEREELVNAIRESGKVQGNGAKPATLPEAEAQPENDNDGAQLFEGAEVVESKDDDALVADLKARR